MTYKTCPGCNLDKPSEDYRKNSGKRDGLQTYCITCSALRRKAHYEGNKAKVVKKVGERNKVIRAELRNYIFDYLSNHPCVDCGESDIVVLDFHHLRDKKYDVSSMPTNAPTLKAIVEEIEKCVVCCANCHRRRHAKENQTHAWRHGNK